MKSIDDFATRSDCPIDCAAVVKDGVVVKQERGEEE
jgi:hypothetical protein